ncbi:hypothetical protein B0J13DRAFT_543612 [Dactylonectria estremocensis]|uniref:Secreted protein n=1 Tax=Dactylonectria estremocensis TaxID=1079267 RepID=A0A9P9FDR8_9HYPO|nr:hypothetical protein B0J13DRAFT_543612 [Dactylonectria estremocensis]
MMALFPSCCSFSVYFAFYPLSAIPPPCISSEPPVSGGLETQRLPTDGQQTWGRVAVVWMIPPPVSSYCRAPGVEPRYKQECRWRYR